MHNRIGKMLTGLCVVMAFSAGTSSGITPPALSPAPPAHAQPAISESAIRDALRQGLRSPQMVDNALALMDVPRQHQEVYRAHLERAWGNDTVMDAFLDDAVSLFSSLDLSDTATLRVISQNFSAAWFQEKALAGLRRLDVSDVREFFRFSYQMLAEAPPAACAAMLREELSAPEASRLELQLLARSSSEGVRGYLDIMRRALIAEINDYPSVKRLGQSQRMVVDQALGSRFLAALEAHPMADQLMLGLEQPGALSDAALCEFNLQALEVVLTEPGQVGDWMLRIMLE